MQDITIAGAQYADVPAVEFPKTGGGTARFMDVSGTTATATDVANGKVFLAADGTITAGTLILSTIYTGSSAPSASLGVDGDIYLQV